MRMHVIETETTGAVVQTTDAGAPEGTMLLRVRWPDSNPRGIEVPLTQAERVRLIGQLASFAPPLQHVAQRAGLNADELQAGDELRDDMDGQLIYTLVREVPQHQPAATVVWQVRWDASEGGGLDQRAWTRGTVTPLQRPQGG